jgi:alginate O-acetyltransferase complex protein AlgI
MNSKVIAIFSLEFNLTFSLMVFSSIIFVFYFLPIFFFLYYLAAEKYKNAIILAGSIFFYAWGAPKFIFVILLTTILDFYMVRGIYEAKQKWLKKLMLAISLAVNLGLLIYFKYSNFFVENLNVLLAGLGIKPMKWVELVLPIGISFYTFETLTYVIDVYRGVHKPLKKFWDYQLYIILFPKLIAGPIIRYHDFADQIYDHTKHETNENRLRGMYRFFIGLGKKVLIANVMGEAADKMFAMPADELSTYIAWVGAISYTFQIYFDFSGYSDMAIGLGQMMGFRFPENFNNPYTSLSITDFWRRWHITLGNWMRNYLYIPLGGNKVTPLRLYFNLWIVFLASGLWHGAAWGFIIWGAYHGFFLVIERLFLGKWLKKIGKAAALYSFFVVMIGWVFFRMEKLQPALDYLKAMFTFSPYDIQVWHSNIQYIVTFWLAVLFSFFTLNKYGQRIQGQVFYKEYTISRHVMIGISALILMMICGARITMSSFNPFIYFRF